jgi:hypothetical protein
MFHNLFQLRSRHLSLPSGSWNDTPSKAKVFTSFPMSGSSPSFEPLMNLDYDKKIMRRHHKAQDKQKIKKTSYTKLLAVGRQQEEDDGLPGKCFTAPELTNKKSENVGGTPKPFQLQLFHSCLLNSVQAGYFSPCFQWTIYVG